MDKKLDMIIERKFQSANQEIPGKFGNNNNGITNFDLTGEEELILDDIDNDILDNSTLSGFENLPEQDELDACLDILCESEIEPLFEHRGKPDPKKSKQRNDKNIKKESNLNKDLINKKYDTKRQKINAKMDRKRAKLDWKNKNASEKMAENNAAYKYHKQAAKNSSGLEKAYHKLNTTFSGGAIDKKIEKLQEKRKKKLAKNQEKRNKKLNESDILLECLFQNFK